MSLKTDYKDDIFAGARKYQMVNNPDGTVSFVDVTDYTQEGDYLGAQEVNAITAEVNRLPCFKKAGGNATSIILEGVQLINGFSITFVVSNNNSREATTINEKPLYKPGTTTAPNLIAGKAVTVWYDLVSDCFFIKASGEGTAQVGDVLAGKTFTNDNDTFEGTMPDNGPAASETINLTSNNQEYTISKGFHSGLRKIKAAISGLVDNVIKANTTVGGITGTYTSDATAGDADVLSGKTYYRNGIKGTGSIPNKAAAIITPGTADQSIAAGQYLSGVQTIKGEPKLLPGNIPVDMNFFGVQGARSLGKKSASGVIASYNTAEPFLLVDKTYGENRNSVIVNGLGFIPRLIVINAVISSMQGSLTMLLPETIGTNGRIAVFTYTATGTSGQYSIYQLTGNAYADSSGFRLPVFNGSNNCYWHAFE